MTAKQTDLINEFISMLNDDEKLLCEPVIKYLTELGYTVKRRKKCTFMIEFEKYGRVISKLEYGKYNMADPSPHLMFWLRFSASDKYSKVFQDAVNRRPEAWIKRGQQWPQKFTCCKSCKNNPRFYHYTNEDGTQFDGCGGYTKWVPGLTSKDVPEILRMIEEQDIHFSETFT